MRPLTLLTFGLAGLFARAASAQDDPAAAKPAPSVVSEGITRVDVYYQSEDPELRPLFDANARMKMRLDDAEHRLAIAEFRLDDKTARLDALTTRVDELEAAEKSRAENDRFKTLGLGVGLSVGHGAESAVLSANYEWLQAQWYTRYGYALSLTPELRIGRVTLRVGLGAIGYNDRNTVLSAQWHPRPFDFTAHAGLTVRVWEGLTVGAGVAWFVPEPTSALRAAKRVLEEEDAKIRSDIDMQIRMGKKLQDIDEAILSRGIEKAGDVVKHAYEDAVKQPRLELTVRWVL